MLSEPPYSSGTFCKVNLSVLMTTPPVLISNVDFVYFLCIGRVRVPTETPVTSDVTRSNGHISNAYFTSGAVKEDRTERPEDLVEKCFPQKRR